MIDKDYYSFNELKLRWNCSSDDIHYLVFDGLLSPSVIWTDLYAEFKWQLVDGELSLLPIKESNFYGQKVIHFNDWVYLVNPTKLADSKYSLSLALKKPYTGSPKSGDIWYGASYFYDGSLKKANINNEFIEKNSVFMKKIVYDLESIFPEIGEKNDDKRSLTTLITPRYSTEWLEIQDRVIATFFNPRRNPDAKKGEIVEWIEAEAKKCKLQYSANIANTIFTIVKPHDHDPKKRRVEP